VFCGTFQTKSQLNTLKNLYDFTMIKLPLILFFVSILTSTSVLADESEPEKLHYQASYKGVLSLFQTMSIADVWYATDTVPADSSENPIRLSSLSVSSENFSMVERLYPMRYQFLSFFSEQPARTLLFENLKVTKKSRKTKHKVGLFDRQNQKVQLFTSKNKQLVIGVDNALSVINENELETVQQKYALDVKAPALTKLQADPVDRLTLLQLIRQQVKENRQSQKYFVTTGDELMTYQVSMQNKDVVKVGNKPVNATKLKIEAYDLGAEKQESTGFATVHAADAYEDLITAKRDSSQNYRHPPIYVWFSLDDNAIPLKFVNYHALGDFIVELTAS